MAEYKKIGILGGTFNPIHNAHITIAEHFLKQLNLDIVFFVPANISPFKTDDDASNQLISEERVKMISTAIANNDKFELDTFEIDNGEISYTISTVEYFRNKYPRAELFLLIGDDQAGDFKRWKDWQKILSIASLCIARRSKNFTDDDKVLTEAVLKTKNSKIIWIENVLLDISSTQIRNFISLGKSIEGLVPDNVLNYIEKRQFYRFV